MTTDVWRISVVTFFRAVTDAFWVTELLLVFESGVVADTVAGVGQRSACRRRDLDDHTDLRGSACCDNAKRRRDESVAADRQGSSLSMSR